ncbi:hypothetical protein GCM10009727_47850 [Actinomadura napierensis]|uniref:Transposase n=1 Tax=Actinomadura napierensis TaxID=267854 RepID=A0ABN2ZRU1_9ACTN
MALAYGAALKGQAPPAPPRSRHPTAPEPADEETSGRNAEGLTEEPFLRACVAEVKGRRRGKGSKQGAAGHCWGESRPGSGQCSRRVGAL